jgi:hypothetical protein
MVEILLSGRNVPLSHSGPAAAFDQSACAATPMAKAHDQAAFIQAVLVSEQRNCTMSKKPVSSKRPLVERPLPRLPHPSWRRAVAGGDIDHRGLSADDFWRRLGL